MARPDERSVYKSIISGLDEAIRYEKKGILKGTRTRRVTIAPVPHYGAKKNKIDTKRTGIISNSICRSFGSIEENS